MGITEFTKLIAKTEVSNVVQSIGYASINSISMDEKDEQANDTPMRRMWEEKLGESKEPKKSEETELEITKLKDSIPKKKVCIFLRIVLR